MAWVTLGLLGNVVRRALLLPPGCKHLLPGATTGPLSERLLPDPAFPTSSEQALRVASCQFLVFSTFYRFSIQCGLLCAQVLAGGGETA